MLWKRTRVIRLRENLGFTGGMNVAYRARSRDARYVLLLNNDAIPTPEGLKGLVEEMEGRPKLFAMMTRAWRDGARLAEKLRPSIRLSAAPLAPFTAIDVVKAAILPRSMNVEPRVVERLYPLES